ncbi:MAG: phytanoyl-CoA dioxygenase family protein [Phycisphaeraceae bacterium]
MTTSPVSPAVTVGVSQMDRYLFDLRGYLLLRGAIDPAHLVELNAIIDAFDGLDPPLHHGEWYGGVLAHTFGGVDGMNLQHIYEAGEPFERLIDHPAWIGKVRHFVGGEGTFDHHHGPLFIDENFVSLRGPGEAIGLHSGGHTGAKRTQYRFHNGHFQCGQINVLMALTEIGPGDGATMVVPGSHKANFPHPQSEEAAIKEGEATSVDGVEAAIEVHMEVGDVLLFVDAINHGSSMRTNAGQRRICVYRYGPSWGMFRHPYRPTPAWLERLTEQRRRMVWPHAPTPRLPNRLSDMPSATESGM